METLQGEKKKREEIIISRSVIFKVKEIFKVNRHSEGKRFDQYKKTDNRKLLWHGTNVAVVAAILKTGLRIMPHSGGRVGKGIYSASENSKSAGYEKKREQNGGFNLMF